jgi:hypothetical protein
MRPWRLCGPALRGVLDRSLKPFRGIGNKLDILKPHRFSGFHVAQSSTAGRPLQPPRRFAILEAAKHT